LTIQEVNVLPSSSFQDLLFFYKLTFLFFFCISIMVEWIFFTSSFYMTASFIRPELW
jgi:hypothetical protein